jgi:uncharacterized protein with HEPN domain
MPRDPRAYLWDAARAAAQIEEFTSGLDEPGYRANALVRSAVERQFEIIGEALNQLSRSAPALAERVPDLPQLVGFRNVLIHGYAVVDDGLVWDAVTTKLPGLRRTLDALLSELS